MICTTELYQKKALGQKAKSKTNKRNKDLNKVQKCSEHPQITEKPNKASNFYKGNTRREKEKETTKELCTMTENFSKLMSMTKPHIPDA